MTTRLTAEEKAHIIAEIQATAITPDWTGIAERYQRTETSIKTLYNSQVTPEDHVRLCIEQMTPSTITEILQEQETICTNCNRATYAFPKQWEGQSYCEGCYQTQFQDILKSRWEHVRRHAEQTNKVSCTLCDIAVIYDSMVCTRYHFDHVNMFEKTDSISTMVFNGTPLEQIESEMDQCQVLCVSCHRCVTAIERKCGFIRLKNVTTREKKDSDEDITAAQAATYRAFMNPIYDHLRAHFRRRHLPTSQDQ